MGDDNAEDIGNNNTEDDDNEFNDNENDEHETSHLESSEMIGHYFTTSCLPRNKHIDQVSLDVTAVTTLQSLLESGTFCQTKTQHIATMMVAMYYMLAAGWKRDLSILFPDFDCNQSWAKTCVGMAGKWSSVVHNSLVLHDTIFSLPKLGRNKGIATVLLSSNVYRANVLKAHSFSRKPYHREMMESRDIVRLSKSRLHQMESIAPIEYFVQNTDYKGFVWAFETLKDVLTPRIMAVFLSHTVHESCVSTEDNPNEENFTAPILQYLTAEDKVERAVRAVLTIQASERQPLTRGALRYSQRPSRAAWAVLADLGYINGRRMVANPLFYGKIFAWMASIEGLGGLTYWETLGAVLIEQLRSKSTKRAGYCKRFFEICPIYAMTPLTWRELLDRASQLPGFAEEYVSLVPRNYLPDVYRNVSERVNIFIREGPLSMVSDHVRPWSADWFPSNFLSLCESNRLPLNLKLFGYDAEVDFSSLVIEKTKRLVLKTELGKMGQYEIALIATSLVYLLVNRTKVDFHNLFVDQLGPQTPWEKCFSPLDKKTSVRIVKMLRGWKLANLFSPFEIRKLIDSSFQDQIV
ncbi:hypothetical protein PSACC_03051 [Paramicrosporidium saccamoebae]|uniref:Uncharacterized protein n=1 Tax=Paramicrosporidium saccamoebae TaxID=1246581 RepID=A0A2H9THA7_9FUNG|nr:hypothetical protein PSACC_03051 [Paramicrosporidium saccamoebae]